MSLRVVVKWRKNGSETTGSMEAGDSKSVG